MIVKLGLRLAVAGGRESLLRLAVTAVGVGVGVMMLLLALTGPAALMGRAERAAWQDADATTPATAPDAALFLSVRDYHDATPMTRAYVAADPGARPPVPPGLERLPAPGELAVSPALRRLLEATPDDELDARYPGRIVATIGAAGLAHPEELVGIIGRTPDQLDDVRSRELYSVRGFDPQPSEYLAALASSVFLVSALLLLAPVVMLVVMATRVAAAQRERRLAAIRLAGATRRQVAAVAAVETGVAAVAGCLVGWAGYEVGRHAVAANVTYNGGPFFLDDVAVAPPLQAAVIVGMTLLTMAIAAGATVRATEGPLAVVATARRRPPSGWWALLPGIGIGAQLVSMLLREGPGSEVRGVLVALSALAALVGLLAGPWLCMCAGRALEAVRGGVAGVIAARRIVADPRAAFRPAVVAMLAVVAMMSAASITAPPADVPRPELAPGVVEVDPGGLPATSVAPLLGRDAVATPDGIVLVRTDGTTAAQNRVRTQAANLAPSALIHTRLNPKATDAAFFTTPAALLWQGGWYLVLIVAVFGLVLATIAGMLERRRSFALLRATGMRLGELYRVVVLETLVALGVAVLLGAGVGLELSLAAALMDDVAWQPPGSAVLAPIGGSVLVALVLATSALPLLGARTRAGTIRYE